MTWRLAGSLVTLLAHVNAIAPRRSEASDGDIGNAEHAARASDHNPNDRGVVTAIDITHDSDNGCDGSIITEALRVSRNPRIKYVIFNRRIFSATVSPWMWRPYSGQNPHTKHFHVSVIDEVSDDFPWSIK